jgi:GNAT superfamily N-acetyltransferase
MLAEPAGLAEGVAMSRELPSNWSSGEAPDKSGTGSLQPARRLRSRCWCPPSPRAIQPGAIRPTQLAGRQPRGQTLAGVGHYAADQVPEQVNALLWRILSAIRFDCRWRGIPASGLAQALRWCLAKHIKSHPVRWGCDHIADDPRLCDDPATRSMYPESRQYLTNFPIFVRLYAGAAFDSRTAHAVEWGAGVALWLPPGIGSDEEGLADLFRRSVEPSRLAEIFDLVQQMASYQPAEPHWFLPLIGADPIRRGKGYGSALLAHMVDQSDHDQRLAHLDSTNSRNVPLYQRHGFERLGIIKVGSCPPVYPMLRRPR